MQAMKEIRKTAMAAVLCLCALWPLRGQSADLSGRILDREDGTGVPGAIVQLKDSSGRVLAYSFASENGEFVLRYRGAVSGTMLEIRQMGYRSAEVDPERSVFPVTVKLIPEATVLADVVVRAPAIVQRSDTLSYYVSQYALEQDRNISDVLKRLPGIEVGKDGQISYNGEPINKFYIDGADFLDGRYGLATENISPEDVASIEVLENHQPVQVLQGIDFSQQAGLNIRLREEARLKWIALLNAGGGASPALYDASAFLMRITGKWQHMETVRADNTGWNPAGQSMQHTVFPKGGSTASALSARPGQEYIDAGRYTSPLDERRTRNNRSLLAHTANSWHLGEGYDMSLNVGYERDLLDYSTGYVTDYFDSAIPPFSEQHSMQTRRNRAAAQWMLQVNRPKYYIRNSLSVDADWNESASAVTGTLSLEQFTETPVFSAANDFEAIRRIGDRLLTVSSGNRYLYRPHTLTVYRESDAAQPERQEVRTGVFLSDTEVRYGWLTGNWSLYARGGAEVELTGLSSRLTGLPTYAGSGTGNPFPGSTGTESGGAGWPTACELDFMRVRLWGSPEASWQSGRWLLTLSAPVSLHLNGIGDSTGKRRDRYVGISPSVYGRFQITAKTDLAVQAKYALLPPSPDLGTGCLMMRDYRNLSFLQPVYRSSSVHSVAAVFRYRNPVTALFANLSAKMARSSYPYLLNQLFRDDRIVTTFAGGDRDNRLLQLAGGISKGLLYGRVVLNLDAGYVRSEAETMREYAVSPYTVETVQLQPAVQGTLSDWLSAEWRLSWSRNVMTLGPVSVRAVNCGLPVCNLPVCNSLSFSEAGPEKEQKSTHTLLQQYAGITLFPGGPLQLTVGGEYYRTVFDSGTSAGLFLLDAAVRWQVSPRLELKISASNLLNERAYRYTAYGLLNGTEYRYGIRGCNVLGSIRVKL